MRGLLLFGFAALIFALASGNATVSADDPKFTIKDVMKKAHDRQAGLLGKVTKKMASKEEREELVELYTALGQNKPPKGPEKSWMDKTGALVTAAKAVAANDKDNAAITKLTTASNCMGCHRMHRGN